MPTPPPSQHGTASGVFATPDGKKVEIRDVWASNLEEEMENIRRVIEKYPYVAMVCHSTLFTALFITSIGYRVIKF